MNVIFLGMPMSGKTTIGKIVAKKLHFNFHDTDELISIKNNISIDKIIEERGEGYFRNCEKELINNYASKSSHVLSIGGGAVNMETKEIIKKYKYRVWLKCSIDKLLNRYQPNEKKRPLLYNTTDIEKELKISMNDRNPFYSECANIIINSDINSPFDSADKILLNINEKN